MRADNKHSKSTLMERDRHSRIPLLGVDQVGDFEVQSEVGLVVLEVAGISWPC